MFNLLTMMFKYKMITADKLTWYVEKGTINKDQYKKITGIELDSSDNSQK